MAEKSFLQRLADTIADRNAQNQSDSDQSAKSNGFERGGGIDYDDMIGRDDRSRDAANGTTGTNGTSVDAKVAAAADSANSSPVSAEAARVTTGAH